MSQLILELLAYFGIPAKISHNKIHDTQAGIAK
jgi:hypothetical protein